MKKFYLLIFGVVFMLGSLGLKAQLPHTYNSITDGNPNNYTLDDKRFWQLEDVPPNNCTNCTINISSNVSMVPDDGSSTAFSGGTVPELNDITLTNSILNINGGITLTINTYVEFFGSSITVGSDDHTNAAVILNDQVDMNSYLGVPTVVRLANDNTYIDARNIGVAPDFDPGAIDGPHEDFDSPLTKSAGIYGILSTPDGGGYLYSNVLVKGYIGTYNNEFGIGGVYTINCNDGGPNTCATGKIFGPAVSSLNPPYGLTFQQSIPLPVNLVQFLASKNADASIKLSWATAQEVNSASFDIERSADQGSWEKIGNVIAKGYSSTTANYNFADQAPLAGNGYYRLKMIDLDGKFQYSKVVAVTSDKDSRPLVIYSNPFSDQIRLKVNVNRAQNLSLTVSDMMGKTYLKQSYNAQTGDNLINLVPGGAAGGMYILHIQGNTLDQTVKLVRQ